MSRTAAWRLVEKCRGEISAPAKERPVGGYVAARLVRAIYSDRILDEVLGQRRASVSLFSQFRCCKGFGMRDARRRDNVFWGRSVSSTTRHKSSHGYV